MKTKTYKCGFNHCNIKEELTSENRVVVGNRSYHPECVKIKNDIVTIRDFYCSHISNTVVMLQLNIAINNIIFDKGMSTDFLLFALKYSVDNNIKINSPYGLHYIINNERIKTAYNNNKKSQVKPTGKNKVEITDDFDFNAPIPNNKFIQTGIGFGDILKGR